MILNKSTKLRLKGTVYENVQSNTIVRYAELPDWMKDIRDGKYKQEVEMYRENKADHLDRLADGTKKSLEAFLCGAVCIDGRKETSNFEQSNVLLADYDRHDEVWAKETMKKLYNYQWIFAVHQTVNHGLRCFWGFPDVPREEFKFYQQVAIAKLDAIVGEPHDRACDHITRLSVASYDPDCWCRPADECTRTVPFTEEELAQIQEQIQQSQLSASKSCVPDDFDMSTITADSTRNLTDEQIMLKLRGFMQKRPYVAKHHHESLKIYGSLARYEGFSTADLNAMVCIIAREYPTVEYDAVEAQRHVFYGYEHPALKRQSDQSSLSGYPEGGDFGIDDRLNDAEIVEFSCPPFSEAVYEKLPPIISDLLGLARNRRQKDFLLASLMTTFSSIMQNLYCHYRGKRYSAHLAFCGISPSGTGKGIAIEPKILLSKIEKEIQQEYEQEVLKWKSKNRRWQLEMKKADQDDRDPDWTKDPGERPRYVPFVGTTLTSNSALIENLYHSRHGMIQYASEMEVLTQADKADFGKLNATYRMALQNEPIFKYYKCDIEPISVEFPQLAMVITGTSEHFVQFVRSVDNGNLSRWAVLTGNTKAEWDDLTPEKDDMDHIDKDHELYVATADKVLDIFHYLQAHPTDVYFHPNQFDRINSFFSYSMEELNRLDHAELSSLVTRGPHIVMRIASTLTGIRKYMEKNTDQKIYIHEDDFCIAMEMAQVFMRHTSQWSTILPKSQYPRLHMKPIDPADQVLQKLPDEFTNKQALAMLQEEAHIGRSTGYEKIKKWKREERIESVSTGVYRKIKGLTTNSEPKQA